MSIIERKYQYYRTWYLSMKPEQRETKTGAWVFVRVSIFSELLRQQEQEAERFNKNCGNYKEDTHGLR
jgi:hypothetical protein